MRYQYILVVFVYIDKNNAQPIFVFVQVIELLESPDPLISKQFVRVAVSIIHAMSAQQPDLTNKLIIAQLIKPLLQAGDNVNSKYTTQSLYYYSTLINIPVPVGLVCVKQAQSYYLYIID